MRSGMLGQHDRNAMQRWMANRPEHARDLLQVEAAWRLSGVLANDAEVRRELEELDSLESSPGLRRVDVWLARGFRDTRAAYVAAAAALVLGIGMTFWYVLTPRSYQTAHGEQRVVTLADGSVVALNTDTRLRVDLSAARRDVFLRRGEALFQVAYDPRRPFVVHAAQGYARAVGTRFNVLAQESGVTVSVLEGRVEVSPQEFLHEHANATASAANAPVSSGTAQQESTAGVGSTMASQPLLLRAGQSAAYVPSGKLVAPEPMQASAERIVAWREGKLRFESWRLDRAVREYNRYAEKPIYLDSPDVAGVEISGVFRIGDSAAFVQALGELVNARVVHDGDTLLLKRAATN